MAIEYTMEKEGNILVVETKGFDESLQEVIRYNDAVKERAEAFNCKKILCDERNLEYRLSITDTYQLGEYLSRLAVSGQIAIVTDQADEEVVKFWENVTNNRGVVAKVFDDVESAREWLA